MKYRVQSLIMGMIILPTTVLAIDCSQLTTNEQIKKFVQTSRESNPLTRDNLSTVLAISPCEKAECSKKNRKKREKKKSVVHSIRYGEDKRTYFMKGDDAPICIVTKGIRKFKCSDCGATYNDQCRSFNTETSIEGTNLDFVDMGILGSNDFKYTCKPLPKSQKYFKITSTKAGGDSPYDRIDSFYEKKRGVVVKVNYYASNILRKVYRYPPKRYIKLNNSWLASDIKVRTTQGSEKKYNFETRVKINQKKKKFQAYDPLESDPYIKGTSLDILFSTN